MSTAPHIEISRIAQGRRDAVLSSFHDISMPDETTLPNDVVSFAFKSGYYDAAEVEILESEAEDILAKIKDGIWSALEVTEAYCKAAAVAQKFVRSYRSCLVIAYQV